MYKLFFFAAMLASGAASAQTIPSILPRGVVNAASFTPAGLPGGAVAQGSIFSIFGQNIGPGTAAQVFRFPLENTLSGVSIEVRQGATRIAAIPLFVSAGQVNALMPSNAPTGIVTLVLTYNGQASAPIAIEVARHAPGVFTATGAGMGWGSLQNFVSQGLTPANSSEDTIKPGQLGILWLTGMGPISGADNVAPPTGNLPYPVQVYVGGKQATRVDYSGRAPGISGLDQIVFAVPNDAPQGCFVPVFVVVNGSTSNSTTVAIERDGRPCSDPHNPIASKLLRGGKVLEAFVSRHVAQFFGTRVQTGDVALAKTVEYVANVRAFDPVAALPPLGTCTTYTLRGNLFTSGVNPFAGSRSLNVGDVFAGNGAAIEKRLTQVPGVANGVLLGLLGGTINGKAYGSLALDAGQGFVRNLGGADGASSNEQTRIPSALQGTNLNALTTLRTTGPLTVNWTAQANTSALFGAAVYDGGANATSAFLCLSERGAASLTVPAYILQRLPDPNSSTLLRGEVLLGTMPETKVVEGRTDNLAVLLNGWHLQRKRVYSPRK